MGDGGSAGDLKKIAGLLSGCSGADIKGVCMEAGMYALRERRVHVTQEDFLPSARPPWMQWVAGSGGLAVDVTC